MASKDQHTKTSRRSSASQRRKAKKEGGSWLYRNSIALIFFAIAFFVLFGLWLLFGLNGYHGQEKWIYIPANATTAAVRDTLKSNLGLIAGNRTYILWRIQGGQPEKAHGMYRIADGERAHQLSRRLKTGRQNAINVTFRGARTMDRVARRIASQMEFSDTAFLEACDNVLRSEGYKPEEYPAALIPDTYQFYITDSAEHVVRRLLEYRNEFWTAERVDQAHRLGLTPVQVATIGSITEEESAKTDERPKIARLYINRLQKHMRLQADPTVKFATRNFELRRITGEHLRTESPYNTYRVDGLPPGPIRIVERQTLEGVLNAPTHNYLYMCAREDFSGYHNFASDYAEHQANARRYQAELNRRNIH